MTENEPTGQPAEPMATDSGMSPDVKRQQAADVRKWLARVQESRKYDEPAREQYARDRRYARGDSGFEVDANVVGTNIDILESFLYARDPDIDVRPAPCAEPPTLEDMRDTAEDYVSQQPDVGMAQQQAMQAVLQDTGDQAKAMQAGKMAADGLKAKMVQEQFVELRKRYRRRTREIKAFADTLEIVISHLWKAGRLKSRGIRWVRSSLTIGVGVLKVSWQERTAPSPESIAAINDLQASIQRAAMLRHQLDDAHGEDLDVKIAEYQRQLVAIKSNCMQVVSRGLVIDVVPSEDFQIPAGYCLSDHLDAPWNSHRIPMRVCDAQSEFELTDEQIRKATRYKAKRPVMIERESAMVTERIAAVDADAYEHLHDASEFNPDESGGFVMVEEIWDRDSGSVMTAIHGLEFWVKDAWQPDATTRFYPFFLLCTSEVDGQRHPQSLVSRSAKLIDEYNRIGSAEAEHRRRVRPKTGFNAGLMSQEDADKLARAGTQEMVPINPTRPDTPIGNILQPITYAQIDVALYDRTRIIQELERIWGIQEALSGSINVGKTATEASIQQSGFNARTSGRRDMMETVLGDMAQYTAELARAHVTIEDAQAIAGPDAFWPDYAGPEELATMVVVDIAAGSSGKPDNVAERQAWSTMLPLLQNGIVQIGQLRQASPQDVADSLEMLMKITAKRAGDDIDMDRLLPQSDDSEQPIGGAPAPNQPPAPPPEPMMTGPQITAVVQVLDQIKTGVISAESGSALLQAAFPAIPPEQVQAMVQGVPSIGLPTAPPSGAIARMPLGASEPTPNQPAPSVPMVPVPGAQPAPAPATPALN